MIVPHFKIERECILRKYIAEVFNFTKLHCRLDCCRCPMYLQYVHRKNASWPDDSEDCVSHFHERKIKHALRRKVRQRLHVTHSIIQLASYSKSPRHGIAVNIAVIHEISQ